MKKIRFRNFILLSLCAFLTFSIVIFAQQAQNQKIEDIDRTDQIEQIKKETIEMFYKKSSVSDPIDEGNRITAIRKAKIEFEDYNEKTKLQFKNKQDLVEIELYCSVAVPVSNAQMEYVVIGDKVFTGPVISGDRHTVFVRIKPSEFEAIKENSLIYLTLSAMAPEKVRTDLTDSFMGGELKQVTGAKFGRINKTIIIQSPVIDEDLATFRKRISQTKTKPNN